MSNTKRKRIYFYRTEYDKDHTVKLVSAKGVLADKEEVVLNYPDKVADFARRYLRLEVLTEEYVYLLCLSADSSLIGCFEVSHGCVDRSYCGAREIFLRMFLCNAARGIIVHNHPSGHCKPSMDDITAYQRLQEAGSIMGVPIVDSVILADDGMVSLAIDGVEKKKN